MSMIPPRPPQGLPPRPPMPPPMGMLVPQSGTVPTQPPQPQSPQPQQMDPLAVEAAQAQAAQTAKALLSDEDFQKLKTRVKNSYEKLRPARLKRVKTIRQYIGDSIGSATSDMPEDKETLVNLLDQMAEVYMQKLASGNPQCLVLTNKLGYKANARYFQLSLNYVLRHIGFRDALKTGVLESLFSMMVMKVGVERPELSQRNYPFDVSAMPFVEPVSFEDFVYDTTVTRWNECRFWGDKYEIDRADLKLDPRNNREVIEHLDAGPPSAMDSGGMDSAKELGGKQSAFGEEQEKDRVTLWDIYMPRRSIVVTFAENFGEKPLRVVNWDGPPTGPYRIGRYKGVPSQIQPKAPAVDGAALSQLYNLLYSKLAKQASRQKVVGFATLTAGKDAETTIRAEDGQVVNVTHPDSVRQMAFGGIDQGNLTFAQVVSQTAKMEWGNLDVLGGLGSSADTLGQEQILNSGASGRMQAMQTVVHEVTIGIIQDVGWYLWNDPLVRVTVTDKIPDTDLSVEVNWPTQQLPDGTQQDLREGEYNDLNFEIVPYSMTEKPPEMRLQMLRQIWNQDLVPMAQLFQAQGINLDAQAYLRSIKELTGLVELDEIIQISGAPPDDTEQPSSVLPMKPANSSRTYVSDKRGQTGGQQDGVAKLIGNMPAGSQPKGGVA